ncbi:MAG: type II toxin-antitoxin system Phd/YefM family antitoxin [Dehalococcoidia bacterium]|nr:type II toxin-antitoxin system Phd/YefM family antitoxin [Dehalococcoidia bacterium]
MLEAVPITQARKTFLPSIERVTHELYKFVVTRRGRPVAVVLSYTEYCQMVETLRLFEDGKLTREIRQGLKQAEREELVPLDYVKHNGT